MSTLNRYLVGSVLLGACMIGSGCGKRQPSKDAVVNAISAKIPPQYTVTEADVEFTELGENQVLAKAKLTVSPREDLYLAAGLDPDVVAAAAKEYPLSQLNAASAVANRERVNIPADMLDAGRRAVKQYNAAVERANRPWIKQTAKSGTPVSVYARASASYEHKEWRFSDVRLEQQLGLAGEPRTAFAQDAHVVGSPEAAQLASDIKEREAALEKALAEAMAGVEHLVEQKKREQGEVAARKEAIEQERRAGILDAVAKGRRYEGRWGTQPVAIEFLECNSSGTLIRARVYKPDDPRLSRFYTGAVSFEPDKAAGYPVKLQAEAPVAGANVPFLYSVTSGGTEILLKTVTDGLEGRPSYYQGELIVVARVPAK